MAEEHSAKKQKMEEAGGGTAPPAAEDGNKGRFKVMGHLVLAMKRFQASLNPTYTFGKRPEEPAQPVPLAQRTTRSMTTSARIGSGRFGSGRMGSGRATSGRPGAEQPGKHHGHKANLLLQSLAGTEQEAN